MSYRLYSMSEGLRSWLMFWRWPRRIRCHGNIHCCQRTDWPNDNNPSRPGSIPWWAPR